jgi:hypothetical protein
MDKLSNDTIGVIFGYLDYNDCKNVEKSKCLPVAYYKDTNKKYMINKMKTEIKSKEKLEKKIKEHKLIMRCPGNNCYEIGVYDYEEENGFSVNEKISRCSICQKDACSNCRYSEKCPALIFCNWCDSNVCQNCCTTEFCSVCHVGRCNKCELPEDFPEDFKLRQCHYCKKRACYDPQFNDPTRIVRDLGCLGLHPWYRRPITGNLMNKYLTQCLILATVPSVKVMEEIEAEGGIGDTLYECKNCFLYG